MINQLDYYIGISTDMYNCICGEINVKITINILDLVYPTQYTNIQLRIYNSMLTLSRELLTKSKWANYAQLNIRRTI